ncbi:MAG: YtxH domain-containing protein [Ferruginibacter sp.]
MSTGKIVTSVLIGAAAGAALGILFAPDKGYKTRKKIMRQKDDFKDMVQDKINDFVDEISEQYEKAKNFTTDYAKSKMSNGKDEAKRHAVS